MKVTSSSKREIGFIINKSLCLHCVLKNLGYSFTENESGYVTSAPEAARDLYSFLTQFFSMFPHLRRNPFYNGGASYGASYAIQIANFIHQKNNDNPNVFINLTGLILDSPWIDAFSQVDYGDYLFNAGLLSEISREHFITKQNEIRTLMEQDKYLDAFSVRIKTKYCSKHSMHIVFCSILNA